MRVAYGLIASVSMWRFLHYGWVDRFFTEPQFHFKYWGLEGIGVLPGPQLHALFWALSGLGLLVAGGVCFRLTAGLLVAGFSYVQLIDVSTYLNHYYLVALLGLLLALSPAGHVGALAPPGRPRPERAVPAAWLYLLRFQVGVVYVFAGLAKLHADWLVDGQPLAIWLASRADFPLLGPLFQLKAAPLALSWAGFLFDTTIVGWLAWRRSRPYAYAALIVFHALTAVLFPIGMFPLIMTAVAPVFFSPDWPRPLWARWRRALPAPEQGRLMVGLPGSRRSRRVALGLGLGYCALQALLPLRFALYGGNVRWHEQGMRFSWRVMVREKNGSVRFRVTSERTGRVYELSPNRYLTPLQEREMSGQPDLIAQLARHIRDDFEQRGLGPVQVRVDAWASLNGRRAARLIDPEVDLARVGQGVAPASWIRPMSD
jgi:hypothetical protein